MIFIVGTGRSGTNMLRDMLNLHAQVYIPQETHWIPKMHEFFGTGRYPYDEFVDIIERTHYHDDIKMIDFLLADFDLEKPELFERIGERLEDRSNTSVEEMNRAFYETLADLKGGRIWGDKTPEYGFYMQLIQGLWPQARFVHVIRDGRDVALSMSRHEGFQRMVELGIINWCPVSFDRYYRAPLETSVDTEALLRVVWDRLPASLRELVKRSLAKREPTAQKPLPPLDDYVRLWERRLIRIADEGRQIDASSILNVKYEEILAEPRRELERIAAFLALPSDSAWVEKAESTLRRNNTRKVERDAQHDRLTRLAQSTLEEYGYV